jgi:hypothetical protein
MEWKPDKKVDVSLPKDKSFEAYQAWVTEIVFTQMTKTRVLSIRTGWYNVANFDLIVGNLSLEFQSKRGP